MKYIHGTNYLKLQKNRVNFGAESRKLWELLKCNSDSPQPAPEGNGAFPQDFRGRTALQ